MNPPCICNWLFASWEADGIDYETWLMEESERVMWGHYASCHGLITEPKGVLRFVEPPTVELKTTTTLREIEDRLNADFAAWFKANCRPILVRLHNDPWDVDG